MFPVSSESKQALLSHAKALVDAMMRSYPLHALFSGDLLVPHGLLRQPVGRGFFLEGNLHTIDDTGPWHEAKATFRLNLASRGAVLERITIANVWFDYSFFNREFQNFHATELNEAELLLLVDNQQAIQWNYGSNIGDLRY